MLLPCCRSVEWCRTWPVVHAVYKHLLLPHGPPNLPQVMTFCEIVHHTRKSFSLEQLGGVVSYLACCVADRSLPFNTQSTCVRLSLNLVECLYQVRVVILL